MKGRECMNGITFGNGSHYGQINQRVETGRTEKYVPKRQGVNHIITGVKSEPVSKTGTKLVGEISGIAGHTEPNYFNKVTTLCENVIKKIKI